MRHGGIGLVVGLFVIVVMFRAISDAIKFILDNWPLFLAVLVGLGLWAAIAIQARRQRDRERETNEAKATAKQLEETKLAQAKIETLAAEREARRPVCAHCGKKTQALFQHRRIDGSPDRRYRNNPLLCNQCFRPYQPVKPSSNSPKNDPNPQAQCEASQ